jgi:hypothetical protein
MDVSGIKPGADFVQTIDEAVGACDTLIVLMGKHWRGGRGPGEERLDDPNDFVRLEVATTLKRNIRVLPVLLRGAVMPTAQELPADIAPLARRLALEITDEDFDHDIQRLVEVIEPRDRAPNYRSRNVAEVRAFGDGSSADSRCRSGDVLVFQSPNRPLSGLLPRFCADHRGLVLGGVEIQ